MTTASSRILTLWSRYSETRWQPLIIHAPPRDEYPSGGYVGAISPDGDYIAFAVPPLADSSGRYRPGTARIYIIQRASQQLITVFSSGIPTRITRLTFSRDGNYLAGMLAEGCGVRLWTRRQWTNPNRSQAPELADDDGYGGVDGISACCPGTDMSACEALPSGSDVIFTGITDGSGPWMITLSDTGLRTYIRPDQGHLRRAGSDFIASVEMKLDRPGRMTLSPDGTRLAVGDIFQPQIAILKRDGLRFQWSKILRIPDQKFNADGMAEIKKNNLLVANPVWVQRSGKLQLYAFGYLPSGAFLDGAPGSNANRIAIFDEEANDVQFVTLGFDTDTSLYTWQPQQDSTKIFYISPLVFGAFDVPTRARHDIVDRLSADLRGNDADWTLKLNTEHKRVFLSTLVGDTGSAALEFDYGEMKVSEVHYYGNLEDLKTAVRGRDSGQGYYDADSRPAEWRFNSRISDAPIPTFFGRPLSLENLSRFEVAFSGAKLPDADAVVWGTDRALRIITIDGTIGCSRAIGSPAFRMNITPDARMLVVAHGDGTIRWYRLSDPRQVCLPLVASLYLTRNEDKTWGFLAWLPNGKFMTEGGAALKDLACYPVGPSNNLGPCIDFQDTNVLFSPTEVKRALAEADSTESSITPQLASVVASKAQQSPASIYLKSNLDTSTQNLSIEITIAGLEDGPRYLTLVAGAGADVPFTVGDDGIQYSQARPYPFNGSKTLNVIAELPSKVQHQGTQINICAAVSSSPNLSDNTRSGFQLSAPPCRGVNWTGREIGPTKKKLWALLIGFSRAPRDGVRPLQFAHQDAINFARFLERDIKKGDLPGKSRFDDVDITLMVAADNLDWPALNRDLRVKTLLNELGGEHFHLLPPQNGHYVEAIKNTLKAIIQTIRDPRRTEKADWDDEILLYFAGHGFSKYIDNDRQHYLQVALVTPDANTALDTGVLQIEDDLASTLRTSNLVSMIIVDACSAQLDPSMDNNATSQRIQLNLHKPHIFRSSPVEGQTELQFLLGSALGRYSYEQQDYMVDDFVPGFRLWPDGVGTKGSGVFSLGLLTSLLCQEAGAENQYTFDSSYRFLKNRFFTSANAKWDREIRPKLEQLMRGSFVTPDPDAFGYPGGESYTPALRSGSSTVPVCGL
ncbi:caspase family protein [Bradyrhizobium oligotrophicum]|uniref:caspase family protein n=1 Tax=Bradyrhizobium oligotrophicum TaxID=44255 RepID=UPI003EBD2856